MDSFLCITASNLAAIIALMLVGWLISLLRQNVTVVDSLWGLGFVLVAWLTFFLADGYLGRQWILLVLPTVWGLRLTAYLTWRNWGTGEDPRYGEWRRKSGKKFWLVSLFKVFLLQALFLWAISFSIQVGQLSKVPDHLTGFDVVGLFIWMLGFVFETVSDWQLSRFKADPANKGKVMDRGLWAYSRHPNYFGEFLIWWGIFAISLSTPSGWWTVISPIIITAVLLKMTGVPMMEKSIVKSRPGYADYIRRTNAFFPWIPKEK